MSAPISTSSPKSGRSSAEPGADAMADTATGADDATAFEGAAALRRAWGAGMRPDPSLTVSQWADRHRMLSGRAAAEPGRYRTARTPLPHQVWRIGQIAGWGRPRSCQSPNCGTRARPPQGVGRAAMCRP